MPTQSDPTTPPVETASVRISSTSSRLHIVAEQRDDVVVEGDARSTVAGGQTTIDKVKSKLLVRVPEGANVVVGTTSGRVSIDGRAGDVAVVSKSGRVSVANAKSVDARTANAAVDIRHVDHDCRVHTGSGRVEVAGCGDADVSTKSGRVVLEGVRGSVRAHCVTGRIELQLENASNVDAETVSGRVSVSMPSDAKPHQPGRPESAYELHECDCTVSASSVSGRVEVACR